MRVLLAIALIVAAPGMASAASDLSFQVWLDDRAVGRHSFQFVNQEEGIEVVSSMNMEVKVLFVSVFKYKHSAREIWRGSCLAEISAKTSVQGSAFELEGRETAAGFSVAVAQDQRPPVSTETEDCVASYAYWDLARLQGRTLVNAQTGQLSGGQVIPLGSTPLPQVARSARQYTLKTEDADIDLWYDNEGQWLALQTEAGGKRLQYLNEAVFK